MCIRDSINIVAAAVHQFPVAKANACKEGKKVVKFKAKDAKTAIKVKKEPASKKKAKASTTIVDVPADSKKNQAAAKGKKKTPPAAASTRAFGRLAKKAAVIESILSDSSEEEANPRSVGRNKKAAEEDIVVVNSDSEEEEVQEDQVDSDSSGLHENFENMGFTQEGNIKHAERKAEQQREIDEFIADEIYPSSDEEVLSKKESDKKNRWLDSDSE